MFATLRPYRPAWVTADLLAGLTVWAVLVTGVLALLAGLLRLGFLATPSPSRSSRASSSAWR